MRSMPIRIFLVLFTLVLIYPFLSQAATEQRSALVIGNSAYSTGPLKNPVNDATDMAASLQKLGFKVNLKKNADLQTMEEAIEDFGNRLKRGGVGLFYYAGHGVQVGGINYLIPVGATINKESDVRFKALDAGRILAEMENANNGVNIVLLDACRDNPLGKSFRSSSRGLAIVSNSPSGTFISYSTSPGQVARDGEGRNSPYTRALLENIDKPGLSINGVFMKVRSMIKKETGQVPWELSSLEGEFYFVPGSAGKATESVLTEKQPEKQKPATAVPVDDLDDETTGMQLVLVKGGCYQMGDTFGGRYASEKPVHEVCVSDFHLGKHEVTVGAFRKFVNDTDYRTEAERGDGCFIWTGSKWEKRSDANWRNPGFSQDDNHPAVCVSWNDAQSFVGWLSKKSGKGYRLPTEAEWEYAARSGGKAEKWAGTSDESSLSDYGWYNANSGNKTHPAGQKKPNSLGIYDMTGNVWEWCSDWYGEKYYGESPRDNPQGPGNGSYRVLRGGGWNSFAPNSRAAVRLWDGPVSRSHFFLGFRVAVPSR